MPNYTTNLNLEKPLQSEQYNIDVFNANADKIDQFAGQVPARALTADKLTTGAKINGVNFKGDTDVITGAGFYYDTVTYGAGDLAFIYNSIGDLELHKSLQNLNIGHNPLTSTGYWEKQDLGGNSGYEVGDIIWRLLPTQDSGKHLLDGTRLSGDGIYGEFVQYIADLYEENPSANYFTTEALWQQSVTTYGVCGKFVYDSVNNTVRLPKITGIIEGTTDVSALGDLIEAGLPNITGSCGNFRSGGNISSGALYITSAASVGGGTGGAGFNANIDASRSNSIYGNSNTVQPQTIKVLYYIVIATSTKTDIQVDIDEVATDLNGKADTDLTNITNTAKIMMAHNAMPSNTYDTLTLGATGTTYTAPADGYFVGWTATSTVNGQYIAFLVNGDINTSFASEVYRNGTNSYQHPLWVPVKKGDVMKVQYTLSLSMFRFYYAVGSESEAQ